MSRCVVIRNSAKPIPIALCRLQKRGVRKWDFYSPLPPFRSPTVDMGVRRRSASVEADRGLGMGKQVLVLVEGLLIFNLFCKKFRFF